VSGEPRLSRGVRHRLRHLLLQEAGKPGNVDAQHVGDVLPCARGKDLLLHGVIVQTHHLDFHIVCRFELSPEGLVEERGKAVGSDIPAGYHNVMVFLVVPASTNTGVRKHRRSTTVATRDRRIGRNLLA
jgi:hypothetical protein